MDGGFALRRVRTNIWREENEEMGGRAGQAGSAPPPSRGDRKELHKGPLAFHFVIIAVSVK